MSFEKEYFLRHRYISNELALRRYFLEVIKWVSSTTNTDFLDGRGKTALVVGCACGFETEVLNKMGYKVYGVDISNFAIKHANHYFNSPEFVICDAQKGLPFTQNTFDIVTCIEVLEHLTYPQNVLIELLRTCKDTVVCTSPNRLVEKPIKTIFRDNDKTHINSKSKKEWKTLIEANLKPNFFRIEAFCDSSPRVRGNLLFFKSFKTPHFGLSLRILMKK